MLQRLFATVEHDWKHSAKLDLTDEGLMADLEKRNAADAGREKRALKVTPGKP